MNNTTQREVLAVSLNSAWQKTLNFPTVHCGGVNRAVECHGAGGGKGVNVARVFRLLNEPVALAAFAGGSTGQLLCEELRQSGVRQLVVESAGPTRCCYTVIDRERGEATELIEPSAPISQEETNALMTLLAQSMREFSAVALCGSLPPGVPDDIYAQIARLAHASGVPVVLDAVKSLDAVLREGVTLLKINHSELRQLSTGNSMLQCAAALLARYPNLRWLAVTDGPEPAGFFSRNGSWSITLPRLEHIVSPIGGGDCATAIMTRFIATGNTCDADAARAFGHACACASASCLTDTPSVFDEAVAMAMAPVVAPL